MAFARFGDRLARDVVEISDDIATLDRGGFWGVVVTFEGEVTCVRFGHLATVSSGEVPTTTRARAAGKWVPLTGD